MACRAMDSRRAWFRCATKRNAAWDTATTWSSSRPAGLRGRELVPGDRRVGHRAHGRRELQLRLGGCHRSPYRELVEAAMVTHKRLFDVHSGKEPPFSQKPMAQ